MFALNISQEAQRAYYEELWVESRDALYDSIKDSDSDSGFDLAAFLEASRYATVDGSLCDYNRMGASWFWFSVMTSIGYGDVVPQTSMGRTFVYTAGFASILLFFGVVGNAGRIMNMVFDDLLKQISYDWLTAAWLGFIYWCGLYFCWMLLLGYYYTGWNDTYLGVKVDRMDGFWFAFSSLSTIGFGDFGVQVEVFQVKDFIFYALLFMGGFVFLSLGFNKLVEVASADEADKLLTLKGRLGNVRTSKVSDNSTLENGEEPASEPPGAEDIQTLQGSQLPFSSDSLQTPMETVFTRENKGTLSGPASAGASNT